MASNARDKVLYAYKLFQSRVNTSIPGATNRIKAVRARLIKYNPPPPTVRPK